MAEEYKEVLLKKIKYHENCPGCKVDQMKQLKRGFPLVELCSLWIIVLSSVLPVASSFPFVYFMVRDFSIAKKEEDIGFFAGFWGCSFMLGRTLTSVIWGIFADRYGRKPVIIIGTCSVVIFNTLFGLSVNFWMAVITRFCLGSFNGLLGPIKAYAMETIRDEYQALAISSVSTACGIGLIIGPAIGGYLAQPADKYPNIISRESIFGKFPYFLPCFVISLFALVVTISSFWLPETLHKHEEDNALLRDSYEALEATSHDLDSDGRSEENKESSILKNWPLMSSIIVFCIFSLHDMAYTEIFSLWANSPKKYGGLEYSTADVGTILSISGFGILVFQLSLYPYLERLLGPVLVVRLAGGLSVPLLSSYPCIGKLSGFSLSLVLSCACVVKSVLIVSVMTALFLMQNKAVKQHQRGAANGFAMMAMSFFKAFGPAAAGVIFSWSEKRQDAAFLPGTQMIFFILSVMLAIGVLSTFRPFLVEAQQ